MLRRIDIVVIGGGQAGLSVGYYLHLEQREFVILDQSPEVGHSWSSRYDSLTLFTPRRYSALPGLPLPGDPWDYPTKDEIADYLRCYQDRFALPVQVETEVISLAYRKGRYYVTTNKGTWIANQVVVATGPFQSPYVPSFADSLSAAVLQMHTFDYRNPEMLPLADTLVIGGGNSGAQIALELSLSRQVYLSVSHNIQFMPYRFLGKSLFWWYELIGLLRKSPDSWVGRRFQKKKDPLYGYELREAIASGRIKLLGRAVHAQGKQISFADGFSLEVDTILWATGFRMDYPWIHIPELASDHAGIEHERGVTAIPGLYVVGLPWQSCRGSALIGWVHRDAEFISRMIIQYGERYANEDNSYEDLSSYGS
ncbi:putative oxidoreductase CzcO [Paenibacillus marchantiophytorum]|uniref:Oxidoreductase CzcO n=1 Tax=Paenibacillus marchantiophytorum TaxID=1619310 RepID=A0ABQ1F241_9BACL|nr:NAD(P)/FAD-dependent oxidoreductase [Paenibacillus marchantiophytorum]GFZ96552.1 putative oxidoreductase CzcO [Paenibacillus marchantiophytorum]